MKAVNVRLVFHLSFLIRADAPVQVTLNTGLSLAALVDLMTTGLLVFYLFKSRGSFQRCVDTRLLD